MTSLVCFGNVGSPCSDSDGEARIDEDKQTWMESWVVVCPL
jgi:hypothetical protein